MADGNNPIEYSYKQSPFLMSTASQGLDGIERRYLTGYADLMLICPYSLESSNEEILLLLEGIDLRQVMLGLHAAYIASALEGRAIRILYSPPELGLGFTWEFDYGANFTTQNGRDGWIALESIPLFRKHYNRYERVMQSLPELLMRVELIDIEDKTLGKRTAGMSEAEIQAKMVSDAAMLSEIMRNDGYLIHGPEKTITVHHRETRGIIAGIEELKRNVLAATDYTELHLWGSTRSTGLAGQAQQERDSTLTQCNIRIERCWRPVVQRLLDNIIDYYDLDGEVAIHWQAPYEGDAREMAEAELMNARASKIRLEKSITSEKEERGRFQGTGRPSPYPMPDEDTAPEVCKKVCYPSFGGGGETGGEGSRGGMGGGMRQRDSNGRFLPRASVARDELDMSDRFQVTAGMRKNASRGLQLRRMHGKGGTIVGVSRARDIANDRLLPIDTVKRMYSYFARHAVDKQAAPWKSHSSPGYIAWMLWGGDEGFAWCKSIRARAIKAGSW